MKQMMVAIPFGFVISACALDPHHLGDPTTIAGTIRSPDVARITQSIKCEIISFVTENRLREAEGISIYSVKDKGPFYQFAETHPTIPLDEKNFTYVALDFKNIDVTTFSIGYDWNEPTTFVKPARSTLSDLLKGRESTNVHIGPSYSDTGTYEYTTTLGIPQDDMIGHGRRDTDAIDYPGIFRYFGKTFGTPDDKFKSNCYNNISNLAPNSLILHDETAFKKDVPDTIQALVIGDREYNQYINFDRIYVGNTELTLAHWLQNAAAQATLNTFSASDTDAKKSESMELGQLSYQFTLDAKPSLDASYKLVASFADPFFPDVSVSQEHSANFQIYLNANNAAPVAQSKTGNATKGGTPLPSAVYIVAPPKQTQPPKKPKTAPTPRNKLPQNNAPESNKITNPLQIPKSNINPYKTEQYILKYPAIIEPNQ